MFDITDEKAQQVAQGLQIPAKPDLLVQLHDEQQRKSLDLNRIAAIISSDVALSANILKAINSPLFGLSRTITDIQQSVMLLGIQNVLNLVTHYEMRHLIADEASIPLEQFWDTTVESARMMVATLDQLQLKRDCPVEDAYALGLFHDCGIAVMAMRFTDYKETLEEANTPHEKSMTTIEENRHATNHAIVGYFVAASWNLPKHLCELILRHHEPNFLDDASVPDSQKDLYGILNITDHIMSNRHHDAHNEWEQVKEKIFFHFGISEEDYNDLEADIVEAFEMS